MRCFIHQRSYLDWTKWADLLLWTLTIPMKYLNCYEKISIHTKTWHFTCYINYTLYENVSQTSETFMLSSNVILSRLNLMSSPVNLNYLKYLNWYKKILISSVCFVFLLAMWVPIDLLPPIDGAVKTASVSTITCTNRDTMQSIETLLLSPAVLSTWSFELAE